MGIGMRTRIYKTGLTVLLLCALSLTSAAQPVRIASKLFTSNVILGDIAHQWLRQADVEAEHQAEFGATRYLWQALQRGDIDIYPDYTGTLIEETLLRQNLEYSDLDSALASYGVAMSIPLGIDDTYILGLKETKARELDVHTISDLKRFPELRFGFSNEFMERADGWPLLRTKYNLPQTFVRGMNHDLSYVGIEAGTIDVMDLYALDAEITIYDMRPLEDDLGHFPEYQAVYLYRSDLATRVPGVPALLDSLGGTLTADIMRALNVRVVRDKVSESLVAADFLSGEFQLETPIVVEEITMWSRIWQHTKEHVILVAISLVAAILLSIPLGIVAAKAPRIGTVILGIVGVLYTIPSLALLVFMIPLMGIGGPPAVVALFLYSLLPIVRNTHAGLISIPQPLYESAEAIGLPAVPRLFKIELPLAAQSIMAGVQTSAVINIGTATLGALIGAGGYGQPILNGIRVDDTGLILQGAIPAAALALVAQGIFALAERVIIPEGRRQ